MRGKEGIPGTIEYMITERENLYQRIKTRLTPIILKSVREAEKKKGYKKYWELCDDLAQSFGLSLDDFKRITKELGEEKIIEHGYHASIGGVLTSINK